MLLFDASDADDQASSVASTNGDWEMSDEENEDAPHENVEGRQVIQEVESTPYNGEPVDYVVTSEVHAPTQTVPSTVPSTIPQQCALITTQLDLVKTQKKNVSNDTSLIPGFKLTIHGRHFRLLPIGSNTRSWNEYRTNAARKKRRKKESSIRSKPMLMEYLNHLFAAA